MSKTQHHTSKILFNHDQILMYDCDSTRDMLHAQQDIITSKINNYPCESNNWHGKFSYWIKNCHFSLDSFKEIVNTISSHIVRCTEEITQYLSSHNNCTISIDFSNQENNANVGIDGASYITNAMHTVSKTLSRVSSNSTDFVIQLKNNGVLVDRVKELMQSCSNVHVHNLAELNIIDGQYIITSNNDNNFGIFLNNTNINDTSCIFNQYRDISESSGLHGGEQVQTALMNPFVLLGLGMVSVVGLAYACNYFISNKPTNQTYDAVELEGDVLV